MSCQFLVLNDLLELYNLKKKELGAQVKFIWGFLMFRGVMVSLSNLRTLYPLSSMVPVASCCGAALLRVGMVH